MECFGQMLSIVKAKKEDRDTIMNLLEKYLYEFSQWEKTDVNENGLYGYEYLDCYFEEKNRFPYLIKIDDKIACSLNSFVYCVIFTFFIGIFTLLFYDNRSVGC